MTPLPFLCKRHAWESPRPPPRRHPFVAANHEARVIASLTRSKASPFARQPTHTRKQKRALLRQHTVAVAAAPSSCVTMSVSGCDCDPRIGKILWSNARNPITGFARAQSHYPRDTPPRGRRGRTWGRRDCGRAAAWAGGWGIMTRGQWRTRHGGS